MIYVARLAFRGRRARPLRSKAARPLGGLSAVFRRLGAHFIMTYCVGIRLNAGLVFLSDSRTNAGLDQISIFRKMIVYENDGQALKNNGMDFVASFILGGQIGGEAMGLFLVYSAGNFIEATRETCFFQIGESKYGKPILDRVLDPATPLEEAAKCALVSMDSTMKSNLSVGLPLDLAVYEADRLQSEQITCIDEQNPYFSMVRSTWGPRLRDVFVGMEDPHWGADSAGTDHPLIVRTPRYDALKKIHNPREKVI